MEGRAPVSIIRETVKPRRVGGRCPIEAWYWGMETRAPMEPVSRPLRRPPREAVREARMYVGGLLRRIFASVLAEKGINRAGGLVIKVANLASIYTAFLFFLTINLSPV
jgi:hypothetical protein